MEQILLGVAVLMYPVMAANIRTINLVPALGFLWTVAVAVILLPAFLRKLAGHKLWRLC